MSELTRISGIGEKRAKGLTALGINSINGLANLDERGASILSQKLGVSFDTVQGWVNEAKLIVRRQAATAPGDGISIVEFAEKNIKPEETAVPAYEHLLTGKVKRHV